MRPFLLTLLLALPSAALAETPMQRAEQALLALDDRAYAAFLFQVHTLDHRYEGPSLAVSLRALEHAAALFRASEQAEDALDAASLATLADATEALRQEWAQDLCPDHAEDVEESLEHRAWHRDLAHDCATTSDLVTVVGEASERIDTLLADFADATDASCALTQRGANDRLRSAIVQLRMRVADAVLLYEPEERREVIEELRSAMRALPREPAARGDFLSASAVRHYFARDAVDRYTRALAAYDAAQHRDRADATRELLRATNALLRSADVRTREIAARERIQRAFEAIANTWLSRPNRVLLDRLGQAPFLDADTRDITEPLQVHLESILCTRTE